MDRPPNGSRTIGYRALGPAFDYLLHLRPAEWPILAAHTALGTVLAFGAGGGIAARPLGGSLGGLAIWVICLNGGTLAINSAFDRDRGDIAYLKNPPPPPRHLFAFGLGLMLAGLVLASWLPWGFRAAYALCLALSVAYSVPPFRLKGVAGVDWLINMWGFGALTPYAGWAATGLPLDPVGRTVLLAFCPLFAGLYPLTQLYQVEEDRARGDRTMAAVLGPRRSLVVALGSVLLAFAILGLAAYRAGWPASPARWAPLAVAAAAWLVVLVPWLRGAERWGREAHQRRLYRALLAWALTDVAVLAGFAR